MGERFDAIPMAMPPVIRQRLKVRECARPVPVPIDEPVKRNAARISRRLRPSCRLGSPETMAPIKQPTSAQLHRPALPRLWSDRERTSRRTDWRRDDDEIVAEQQPTHGSHERDAPDKRHVCGQGWVASCGSDRDGLHERVSACRSAVRYGTCSFAAIRTGSSSPEKDSPTSSTYGRRQLDAEFRKGLQHCAAVFQRPIGSQLAALDQPAAGRSENLDNLANVPLDLGRRAEGHDVLPAGIGTDADSSRQLLFQARDRGRMLCWMFSTFTPSSIRSSQKVGRVAAAVEKDVLAGLLQRLEHAAVARLEELPPTPRADQRPGLRPPIVAEEDAVDAHGDVVARSWPGSARQSGRPTRAAAARRRPCPSSRFAVPRRNCIRSNKSNQPYSAYQSRSAGSGPAANRSGRKASLKCFEAAGGGNSIIVQLAPSSASGGRITSPADQPTDPPPHASPFVAVFLESR